MSTQTIATTARALAYNPILEAALATPKSPLLAGVGLATVQQSKRALEAIARNNSAAGCGWLEQPLEALAAAWRELPEAQRPVVANFDEHLAAFDQNLRKAKLLGMFGREAEPATYAEEAAARKGGTWAQGT